MEGCLAERPRLVAKRCIFRVEIFAGEHRNRAECRLAVRRVLVSLHLLAEANQRFSLFRRHGCLDGRELLGVLGLVLCRETAHRVELRDRIVLVI